MVAFCRPLLRAVLLRTFVLSGRSSSPTASAACCSPFNMSVSCCNELLISRTSSAKLKLVSASC